MQYINEKETRSSFLEMVLFLFSIVTLCSVSGYRGITNYISAFCVVIIVIISLGHFRGIISTKSNAICVSLFMLFYILSSFINLDASNLIIYTFYNLVIFSPIIIADIFSRTQNEKYLNRTLTVIAIIWSLIGIITLVTYIMNPRIARLAAAYQEQYAGRIFGGYNFAYGSCLLLVYLFSNILKNRYDAKEKLFAITTCVFLFLVIYFTESTLTTFASIFGLIVGLFLDRNKKNGMRSNYRIIKLVFFGCFLLITYFIIERNVDLIMAWVNRNSSQLFIYRIGEILRNTFYSDTTGHFAKRSTLVFDSWNMFCQSPIFGWGYKYGNVFSVGKQMGIGNHSELFDILAKYGLVGGTPLLLLYFRSIKKLYKAQYSGLIVALIMLLLFNPFMSFDSFLILFFVIPAIEYKFRVRS